jgi:hypothetical protein
MYGTTASDSASGPAAGGSQRPFVSAADIRQVTDPVENIILKYPGAALASAFLVGVLVAWLIKRK